MAEVALPALPAPQTGITPKHWGQQDICTHTAAEMRAFAREAVMADRRLTLPVLIAAREHIAWWVAEHGCCKGAEVETMALLEAAIRSLGE